jgi:tRNA pseudouridine38-40 synthase
MVPGPLRVSVAGRTDAGVHAEGQVVSLPATEDLDPVRIQRALNALLAPEVVVREARLVGDGFDARRSASSREYRYRLDTGDWPDPFTARFVWHRPGRLPLPPMRAAARLLVGEHDFASFCRAPEPPEASTTRSLRTLAVSGAGERVEVRAVANSFLHQMVRSLVGTLVAVGAGRISPDAMPEILEARDRSLAGQIAPPQGLTLVAVRYGRRRDMTREDA